MTTRVRFMVEVNDPLPWTHTADEPRTTSVSGTRVLVAPSTVVAPATVLRSTPTPVSVMVGASVLLVVLLSGRFLQERFGARNELVVTWV